MASEPLYSVGTYDWELGRYTPQVGLSVPSYNISIAQLRQAVRELRLIGYTAHRRRDPRGDYWNNDTDVLIQRTDGAPESEINRDWNARGGGGVSVNQGGLS